MMEVKTEKTFVVRMNAEEAGVMLDLLGMIGGPPNSLGRSVAISMSNALELAGALRVCAFKDDGAIYAEDLIE